ncbi:hypothetical protein HPB52_008152 [Rhipicephalus sanguineus]|uniref:Uncharacterized protein n=1 Tax=Rhipicephalus sanguineus TaxID=34632 RepID=A0A9D4QM07_RHISA|nr:hypothetical protein HPB52_008152 [Rhipicephalus sanguineus]
MHPKYHAGRRRAKATALLRRQDHPDTCFANASLHPRTTALSRAFVTVAKKHGNATAEASAIALAIRDAEAKDQSAHILTDSQDACRLYMAYTTSLCDEVDPYTLRPGTATTSKISAFPEVSHGGIVNYLVFSTNLVTVGEIKAYKSMESHNHFTSGWVKSLSAKELRDRKFDRACRERAAFGFINTHRPVLGAVRPPLATFRDDVSARSCRAAPACLKL